MVDKPPSRMSKREQEEKYFAEQEARKRKELREKLNQKRETLKQEHLKDAHWMKCPKCGHNLVEKKYEDIMIDQCSHCNGIYLDAGELELLLASRRQKGFFSRFLETIASDKE